MKRQFLLILALVLVCAPMAFAVSVPTTGSSFYEIYDIVVNDIVTGPPGMALAVGGIGYGGMQLFRNAILPAVGSAIGSILILMSPTIAEGLGALIL